MASTIPGRFPSANADRVEDAGRHRRRLLVAPFIAAGLAPAAVGRADGGDDGAASGTRRADG
jgi:hypothetical protein